MTVSSARTLKGPRRFVRRVAHRANSPQWQFLRGFLKNPVMVGSVIPSSKVLIDKMLAPVGWDEVKLFVEYGPGVGTFTRPVLERLPADPAFVPFDIIFLDPPYNQSGADALNAAVAAAGHGADVVLEHSSRVPPPATIAGLVLRRDLVSGDSALAFYNAI